MKPTAIFKTIISDFLEKRAETDSLFQEKFKNEKKNIDDCITFILNEVKAIGCNGFADEEIFSMAIHYYDEEEINIGAPVTCNVVVNHSIEITEEEKEEEKQKALEEYRNDVIKQQKAKKVKPIVQTMQIPLFDETED